VVAVAAAIAADQLWQLGLLARTIQGQLRAAARAVAQQAAPRDQEPMVYMQGPDGSQIAMPLVPSFDPQRALELALDLEQKRREYEAGIARLRETEPDEPLSATPLAGPGQVCLLWSAARTSVCEFLAVEPDRAAIILAALGWPWLGDDPAQITPSDLAPPFPERPVGPTGLPPEVWRQIVREADRNEPWVQTADTLAAHFSLGEGQLRAAQAQLCRRDAEHAFRSLADGARARRSFARLADLAPAQVNTVFRMAGAQELLRAGASAFPTLIAMLDRQPALALPLLRECVRTAGVRDLAVRAAAQLGGPGSLWAERTIAALGPFGLEAVLSLSPEQVGRAAQEVERLRRLIKARWPEGDDAFEALGKDAALWRRWYRQARPALQ